MKLAKILLSFVCCPLSIMGQNISTLAGNGIAGYVGDSINATATPLNNPFGVAVDAQGSVYIADRGNNRIRKVDPMGVITTIAGTGNPGYNGDNVPATNGNISSPTGVAVAKDGTIYIADRGNNRVRKVKNGVIGTVAGTGAAGYSGDGGPATAAQLSGIRSIVVDKAGDLFISDQGNGRVRKISTTGNIETMAGNGTQGYTGDEGPATASALYNPAGLAVDDAENLYIADVDNERVRMVDAKGIIHTIAGTGKGGYNGDGGQAKTAELLEPTGLCLDKWNNLYIADSWNQRIRMVNASGYIRTVAGSGTIAYSGDMGLATNASLNNPYGIAIDNTGNLYIADNSNQRIRYVNSVLCEMLIDGVEGQMCLYPNPSKGHTRLMVTANTNDPVQIYIYNLSSATVQEMTISANDPVELDLKGLPGLYIVKAVVGTASVARQLVYDR